MAPLYDYHCPSCDIISEELVDYVRRDGWMMSQEGQW